MTGPSKPHVPCAMRNTLLKSPGHTDPIDKGYSLPPLLANKEHLKCYWKLAWLPTKNARSRRALRLDPFGLI